MAGIEIVKTGDEAISAGRQAAFRERQGEGIDHGFAGRPQVGGIEAVEGLAVPAANDLAVLVEQLQEDGVGFVGGLERLPVEGDGEAGDWRLEMGRLGGSGKVRPVSWMESAKVADRGSAGERGSVPSAVT